MKNLLALLFFCLTNLVQAQTLRLILVVQENSPAALKDGGIIREEMQKIAEKTGMNVKIYYGNRDDALLSDVLKLVIREAQSEDVVWFYYTGHGGNSGDGFPQFSNSAGYIKETEVADRLFASNARLKIVMYDCCNIGATSLRRTSPQDRNYQSLFKYSRGTIMACSSTDSQASYGSPQVGSFFSVAFWDAVGQANRGQNMWQDVFERTRQITNDICRETRHTAQNPKFEVNVITTLTNNR